MTDLVVNEIVESKVSKTEMIEMIMTEEESVLSEQLVAAESKLMNHLEYKELVDQLNAIYLKIVKEKHKDIYKMFTKLGKTNINGFAPYSGLANRLGSFKIAYKANPANYSGSKVSPTSTVSIGNISIYDHATITSQKFSSYMRMILVVKSPEMTAFVKKVGKIEKDTKKVKLEIDTLKKQLNHVRSSTRLVKARLTRNLLESTAEGRLMLKELEKVKGKVVGQLMIQAGGK